MEKKVLVSYASKGGSTAEIAARVAAVLEKQGLAVDLKQVDAALNVKEYDAVIMGSAIRAGQIMPEATALITARAEELKLKPFHAFVVCLSLKDDSEANRKQVSNYLNPVRALVQPASEGLFAGVMDLKKLNFIEKGLVKMMKAPIGDFRNWEEIETWSESLAASLG